MEHNHEKLTGLVCSKCFKPLCDNCEVIAKPQGKQMYFFMCRTCSAELTFTGEVIEIAWIDGPTESTENTDD
jgi:RNase P subunit RPR2